MGPSAHFEQFIAIGKIEAAPTELQIQTDDNGWPGHLTSNLDRGNYTGDAPIVFPERALRLGECLVRRTFLSPRFMARDFVVHCLRKFRVRKCVAAHSGFLSMASGQLSGFEVQLLTGHLRAAAVFFRRLEYTL
jgi:hypothetical protein